MIESGRTNAVPKTLIILCIGLFVMRAAAVFYGTFFQQPPAKLIAWQVAKPIDKSRRDLLSKPYLFFFYEDTNQLQQITAQVFENMLFQNREIAHLIKSKFNPVKVAINENKDDGVAKSLNQTLSVYRYPSVYIALPNGTIVQNTSWQSDRMFQAFLGEALMSAGADAATESMKLADWGLACEAYERAYHVKNISNFSNLTDAIYWSIALRHEKNDTRAKAVLEAERNRHRMPMFLAGKNDWPAPCADYLLGKISRDELLKMATAEGDKYGYKTNLVHYVCGADLLLRGKKEEAIKELKIAAIRRSTIYLHSAIFAGAELQALGETLPETEKKDTADYRHY